MVESKSVGKAVFITNVEPQSESEASSRLATSDPTRAMMDLSLIEPAASYKHPPATDETFDEFEERIEENIGTARKALREGQRDTNLLHSELRSVQFRVFNENQTTVNQIRSEIESLCRTLNQSVQQDQNEAVFLERQMGAMRTENAQDQFFVRQLAVKEEQLTHVMGSDADFFEVIPGYATKTKHLEK